MSKGLPPVVAVATAKDFLTGESEMAARIREFDWLSTALGPIGSWPPELKAAVSIMLQSPVPMVLLWGPEGVMIYNDAYSAFAGQRHPALLGQPVTKGWPEVADFNRTVMEAGLSGRSLSYKDQELSLFRNHAPERVWLDLNYSPVVDEQGTPRGVLAIVVETTERVEAERRQRQAEAALQADRERLYTLFMQAPSLIAVAHGPEFVLTFANPMYLQAFTKGQDIIGKPLLEVMPELKGQPIMQVLRQVYKSGKPYHGNEVRIFINRSGSNPEEAYFNVVYQPFHDPYGNIDGVMMHAVDVTRQVYDHRKTQASEQRFKTLIERSSDAIELVGPAGNIMYASDSVERVLGYTPQEVLSMEGGPEAYVHPDDMPHFTEKLQELIANPDQPVQLEYRVRHKDGSWQWVETVAVNHLKTKGIEAIVANFRNVTDRHLAEVEVRESEERLRFMAESMPQMVFTAKPDGTIDYFNYEWIAFTGLSYDQLTAEGIRPFIHPHDREEVVRHWRKCIETGKPYRAEYRYRRYDGQYHWHLTLARPMRDEQSRIVRWFGSSTDIQEIRSTRRRKNELEKITLALRQQRAELLELNAAKDDFISIASHQLRTPATATKQYIGMLLEGFAGELTRQQRLFLERAQQSNERQIGIVKDLLHVASIDAGKVTLAIAPTELVGLIAAVIGEQHSKFMERQQTVRFVHDSKSCIIKADSDRLQMVIENLLDNASKYSRKGTTVTVRLLSKGGTPTIAIEDEGVGIQPAEQDKLFRKFSRIDNDLSRSAGGSGLGLYWAKKIIDLHNGRIDVQSVPGKGTTFTITLPTPRRHPKSALSSHPGTP